MTSERCGRGRELLRLVKQEQTEMQRSLFVQKIVDWIHLQKHDRTAKGLMHAEEISRPVICPVEDNWLSTGRGDGFL